jgi:uncharacterized OB-fold protein
MANCNYCGKLVAPKAKSCPHCGQEEPAKMGFFSMVVTLVVLAFIVSTCVGNGGS